MPKEKESEQEEEKTILQDGVSCPSKPPWTGKNMKWTAFSLAPNFILGVYILFHAHPAKLAVWIAVWVLFCYPLRYVICVRCPYYSKSCSTYFGLAAPLLLKKQEDESMKLGLWLDTFCVLLIVGLPIPEVWQLGGWIMLSAWFGTLVLMSFTLGRLACACCPLPFCLVGKMNRFWARALPF